MKSSYISVLRTNNIPCFDECYVSVRDLCDCESSSGIYADDLPGISLVKIALTSDDTAAELVKKINRQTNRKIFADLISKLGAKYTFKDITQNVELNTLGKDSFFGNDDNFYGWKIDFDCVDKYKRNHISSLEIYVKTEVEVKKTIYLFDGLEEYREEVVLKNGLNKIPISFDANSDCVYLFLNLCDIELGISPSKCACDSYEYCKCNTCASISYVMSEDGMEWVGADALGVRLCVQCKLSVENILCQFRDELNLAYQYLFGIMFANHVLNSGRCNYYVTNSESDMERLLLQWNGGIDKVTGWKVKGEYWKLLDNFCNNVNLVSRSSGYARCNNVSIINTIP